MTAWGAIWLMFTLASILLVIVAMLMTETRNHRMTPSQAARRARSRRRVRDRRHFVELARRSVGLGKTVRRA